MTQVKEDCTVNVHFDCETSKGVKFSSRDNDQQPIEFKVGEGKMIKAFEEAVLGLSAGDKKSIKIGSDEAYGQRSDENIIEAKRSEMPEGTDIQPGTPLMMHTNEGQEIQVMVTEVTDEKIMLDANHPLAGHDLNFEIEIISVK